MSEYPKFFIKAALIYLGLGILLGIAIGTMPEWSVRIRFVHIHLNLLGFMTMMIAGVAYHVLPRFAARGVPWPEGVKYHFIFHNVGLVGMLSAHLAGGFWKSGLIHFLFVLFALMVAIGLFFMIFNLYAVLSPARASEPPESITADMKVAEVLDHFPNTMPVFLQSGFTALTNPAARQTFAKMVSVDKACEKHGVETGPFIAKLNAAIAGSGETLPPQASANSTPEVGEGLSIQKGEYCKPQVQVGSLIKAYPETKEVFKKHYGESCFSCPGQIYETVEQTAQMHNMDTALILKEINDVITSVLRQ